MKDDAAGISEAAGAELPKVHVLSYVTVAHTPTHVRQVTAQGLLIVAVGYGVLAAAALGIAIFEAIFFLRTHSAAAAGGSTAGDILRAITREWAWLIVFGILGTCGIGLWVCVSPVRRGRKAACYIAKAILVPMPAILVFLAAGSVILGLVEAVQFVGKYRHPSALLLSLLVPPLVFGVLLLGDLMAYLAWIAQHPITENPRVSFFSGTLH